MILCVGGGLVTATSRASRRVIRSAERLLSKRGVPSWQILHHFDRLTASALRCSWVHVKRLHCCLEHVFVPLALITTGPTILFQQSKRESLEDTIVSHTRHMAGPTKLRCNYDGLHACDVAAGEDLGVWDLVSPRDSTYLSEAVRYTIR